MCLRFDPSTAFCPADGRYNSTLSLTDSHQVHQRLAFQIVKEHSSYQLSALGFQQLRAHCRALPPPECPHLISGATDRYRRLTLAVSGQRIADR